MKSDNIFQSFICVSCCNKPFPNHVHDHYVFGLVKQGKRRLACGGIEYEAHPGDLLLFNPAEAHGCTQLSLDALLRLRSCVLSV